MKKYGIILLAILASNLIVASNIQARENTGENASGAISEWDNLTEEELLQREDSIRKALYPDVKIEKIERPDTPANPEIKKSATAIAVENPYVPNSVPPNKTKALGEIPINSSFAPSGSIAYSVPVEIYPDPHGFQPQLSLAYNHLSGNGVAGIGWNLSGLSAISRTVGSAYYDGQPQGIRMRKDDAFVLDGMRLIKLSEVSGPVLIPGQIKYETERGNIKVTATTLSGITRYFEVFYPNGCKGVFGYTDNYSNYPTYPLTSFSDLQGNTITYSYTRANNRYLIDKISYNGASVEFQYTTRQDPVISFNGGLKVTEDKLLQNIVCKWGSTVLRTYSLTYRLHKQVSALTSIGCTASGSSFNPLQFYYGENNTAYTYTKNETQLLEWYNFNNKPEQITVCKGKFDYGTEDDGLIVLPAKDPYYQHYRHSTWFRHSENRYDNYYDGTEKIFLYPGLNSSWVDPMPNLLTEAGFIQIFCADLDGKWEEEVIKVNNRVLNGKDHLTFKVYSPNLYTGLGYKYTRTFDFSTVLTDADDGQSIRPKFYFSSSLVKTMQFIARL